MPERLTAHTEACLAQMDIASRYGMEQECVCGFAPKRFVVVGERDDTDEFAITFYADTLEEAREGVKREQEWDSGKRCRFVIHQAVVVEQIPAMIQ